MVRDGETEEDVRNERGSESGSESGRGKASENGKGKEKGNVSGSVKGSAKATHADLPCRPQSVIVNGITQKKLRVTTTRSLQRKANGLVWTILALSLIHI